MLVNSSSSNDSFVQPHSSSIDSSVFPHLDCFISGPSSFIYTALNVTHILLLLPLCIFILHHGLQLWRQKRSTSSAATVSHSDCFTYHLVIMELVAVFGCVLICCGIYTDISMLVSVAICLFNFAWYGETFFHVLTCVERYLAVVHPITYRSLRNQRGIRIRNISITCVWLLCFSVTGLLVTGKLIIADFSTMILSIIITSFCSLSVLCVLIRPGPGDKTAGARERVNQSKLRAFYTIMSILGALVLRFSFGLGWTVLHLSEISAHCVALTSFLWFNLPSNLVLPLLFLHRAGKLVCCRRNIP